MKRRVRTAQPYVYPSRQWRGTHLYVGPSYGIYQYGRVEMGHPIRDRLPINGCLHESHTYQPVNSIPDTFVDRVALFSPPLLAFMPGHPGPCNNMRINCGMRIWNRCMRDG